MPLQQWQQQLLLPPLQSEGAGAAYQPNEALALGLMRQLLTPSQLPLPLLLQLLDRRLALAAAAAAAPWAHGVLDARARVHFLRAHPERHLARLLQSDLLKQFVTQVLTQLAQLPLRLLPQLPPLPTATRLQQAQPLLWQPMLTAIFARWSVTQQRFHLLVGIQAVQVPAAGR